MWDKQYGLGNLGAYYIGIGKWRGREKQEAML